MVSSHLPAARDLNRSLAAHSNLMHQCFLRLAPASHFFNSVHAGISLIKITFDSFALVSDTHTLVSQVRQLLFLTQMP